MILNKTTKHTSTQVPVTLLHDGDFLDDLLKIRLHRNLFDGYDLPRLFIMCFKHTSVRPADTKRERGTFNMMRQLFPLQVELLATVYNNINEVKSVE